MDKFLFSRKMVVKSVLISVFILLCFTSESQTRRFKHLTSVDGISQSEVYTFLEDSKGYMWFGTVDGLNRYDGYSIDIFNTNNKNPNSLSNNTIRSLGEDQYGRIWIGTDDGLNYYDPLTELIYKVKVHSSKKLFTIWSMLILGDQILLGTNDGLWQASIQSKKVEVIESDFHEIEDFTNNKNISKVIWKIVESKRGGIWIQTSSSVSRIVFQQNKKEPIIIEDLPFNTFRNQTTAVEDSSGNLWLASSKDGLARYDPVTKKTEYLTDNNKLFTPYSKKCSALAVDQQGNIWVGTLDRGLLFVKYDSLKKEFAYTEAIQNKPTNLNSINSNLIYSLYVSSNNNLWVGTIGSGVNIYDMDQKKFEHYKFQNASESAPISNFIRAVYVDENNNIWTGTHNNGLFLFDRNTKQFQKLGFDTQSIFYIDKYKDNKYLICTGDGLFLVEYRDNRLTILSNCNFDKSTPFFYAVKSQPEVYWCASIEGLYRMKVSNNEMLVDKLYSTTTNPGISANNCRVLFFDKETNKLWVGTEGGGVNILELDSNHYPKKNKVLKQNSNELNSLSNNYVRCIIKDKNKNIWIGTYEGLNKLSQDSLSGEVTFKTFTKKDGLPNSMIELLVEDENKCLWIGTNGGLSKYSLTDNRFINYTINDGLQSNEFSEHTVFKKPDGEILMGGINGINAFYPENIKISLRKPKTTITDFYLFNKRIQAQEKTGKNIPLENSIILTDSILLSPTQKNIGFKFSAMMYPNAEKVKYAYKLEGFDIDWNYTSASNRIANYTNLNYGDYIFKVKSTNTDGIWEDAPKEIFISIKTPFRYTWFAYILYLSVLVLIFLYFSHFTIIRYTTKKNLLLEKEHNEKLHNLDELRTKFFINISHDLRTPLTLISGPLDNVLHDKSLREDIKEKLLLVKRNVKRLNYLVEQLLDVRKAESGKLTVKHNYLDIVSFTKNEMAHFSYAIQKKGLDLELTFKSDKIMTCFDPGMISKVYFNIISNAIKFTNKGKINISIEKVDKNNFEILKNDQNNSFIKVEIQDTGKGIPKEQQARIFDRFYQDQQGKGYGIGLSHTKELIDAHEGYVEVESIQDVGLIIRFFLPDIRLDKKENEINDSSTEDIYVETEMENETSEFVENSSAKTILVIEDNVDMLNFIKQGLNDSYNVVLANNGAEGLRMANTRIPDLIVSDVMMPNMDGIEFCKQIKSNIKTSHIPVILLTAKVDLQTKYEGIETGADDFIPKPFEMEYLCLRINNLLKSREQLRRLFQNNVVLEPSAVTVNSIDERFLASLMESIEENMSDSNFSINSLESELGMSHSSFYRKIKSLTGQSGQEILQNMRMKRARQILSQKKGLRIAEVSYMVGFSNPKYFSKCFKDMYGYAPSDMKNVDD